MPPIRLKTMVATYSNLCKKLDPSIRVPNLLNRNTNQYTIQGLSFVFFGTHLAKIKSKLDLISFLRKHGIKTTDPQPRHLGMQYGLDFMIMGSYHPCYRRKLRAGEYCLMSLSKPHPAPFACAHRDTSQQVSQTVFEKLKQKYHFRCACCGSQESQPNLKNPKILTSLEKGHMNPKLALTSNNCIPICSVCNRVYQNKVLFTARGFVRLLKDNTTQHYKPKLR